MTENLVEQHIFNEPLGLVQGEDRDEMIVNAINKLADIIATMQGFEV